MATDLPATLRGCFENAPFVANRIGRKGGRVLGQYLFDVETASDLGWNQKGVLVTKAPPADVVRHLAALRRWPGSVLWIAVPWNKALAWQIRRSEEVGGGLLPSSLLEQDEPRETDVVWRSGSVLYSTPEGLRKSLAVAKESNPVVPGLLIVDPHCCLHLARDGFLDAGGRKQRWDRPQLVADFKNGLALDGWTPPVFIFTEKEAGAVELERLMSAYCLQALDFVDGRTFVVPRVRPLAAGEDPA